MSEDIYRIGRVSVESWTCTCQALYHSTEHAMQLCQEAQRRSALFRAKRWRNEQDNASKFLIASRLVQTEGYSRTKAAKAVGLSFQTYGRLQRQSERG